MSDTGGPAASAPESGEDSAPQGLLGRLDAQLYSFELAVVTSALLVMSLTYVLKVLHREMNAGVTAFGKLILKMRGYPDIEDAPADVIASVVDVWTPTLLAVTTLVLAVLALRTRWIMGVQHDGARADAAPPEGPPPWGRWVVLGLVTTAGLYGLLEVIATAPSKYLCLVALAIMVVPAVIGAAKTAAWGALLGVLLGGGAVGAFFLVHAGATYTWTDKLATVGLMYVGFLGASMATRDNKHIKVDVVRKLVPAKWLHLYNAVSNLVTIAFLVFLAGLAFIYVWIDIRQDGRIEGLEMLPHSLVSGPVLLALFIMILRFSAQAWRDLGAWRRGEIPAAAAPGVH